MSTVEEATSETIAVLSAEHVAVGRLLDELASALGRGDLNGASVALASADGLLGEGLDEHIRVEDRILFPAVADELGTGMVGAFTEEHVEIQSLRDEVVAGAGRGSLDGGRLQELCDLLGSHMAREDHLLFPAASEILADRGQAPG